DYPTWVGRRARPAEGDCWDQVMSLVGGQGFGDGLPLSAGGSTDWRMLPDRTKAPDGTSAIVEPLGVGRDSDLRSVAAEAIRPTLNDLRRREAAELDGQPKAGRALTALILDTGGPSNHAVVFEDIEARIFVFDPRNREWLRKARKYKSFSKAPA